MTRQQTPLLSGVRIVEISDHPAVEFAAKLLSDGGATVIKVEPPGGSPNRHLAPIGYPDPSRPSLHYWHYNREKQVLFSEISGTASSLRTELARAHIVLTSFLEADAAELALDYSSLRSINEALVVCAVTPFGQTGPWSRYKSSDLVSLAAGGMLQLCGYDDHELPPMLPGGGFQSYHVAGLFAVNSILISLLGEEEASVGDYIDVSIHESIAVSLDLANPYWFYPRARVGRQACRGAAPEPTQPAAFQAGDGRWLQVHLAISEAPAWKRFVEWLDEFGFSAGLDDQVFQDPAHRRSHAGDIYAVLEAFVGHLDAYTLFRSGQRHGVPVGIIYAPEELLDDPHLQERNFFRNDPVSGLPYPSVPYDVSMLEQSSEPVAQ